MKKLYIKFEEGNEESLKLACDEAERLGYVLDDIAFEGKGLLVLSLYWVYKTYTMSEKALIESEYSEHILPLVFKRGERVLVGDTLESCILERIFLAEIKGPRYPFHCVTDCSEVAFEEETGIFNSISFKFCKPLIKAKKKMTIAEIENLLGYEILVTKD